MATQTKYTSRSNAIRCDAVDIVRRMPFDQGSQTSGCVVRLPNQSQLVLVKGSFEKMAAQSSYASPALAEMVSNLSKDQYYVITIGKKVISGDQDISATPREELESGIDLIGLLLFKNDLKEDSAQAIAELKAGATRVVMITGDSVEAGIGVARAVDILPKAGAPGGATPNSGMSRTTTPSGSPRNGSRPS